MNEKDIIELKEKKIKNDWHQVSEVQKLEEAQGSELEKQRKRGKKTTIIICVVALCVLVGILGFIQAQRPYAITADEKDLVYVSNKSAGTEAIEEILNDYKPEGTEVKKVSTDKELDVQIKKLWEDCDTDQIISKEKAIKHIKEKNKTDKPLFTATIVGKKKVEEDYVPETNYIKDDEMYAGESRVEKEPVKGRHIVTHRIVTENGNVKKDEIVKEKILKEGKAATIYKGTLGLPEGEDWKTYEGDPIFEGADDLVAISLKYQGVPYRYGGASLVTGVDCVQFVRQIYAKYGINLANHHSGLRKSGVGVSYSNMKAGDIICYSRHVAIYIGNGKIIHATHGAGVHVSNVYKGQKIVTIRRVVK